MANIGDVFMNLLFQDRQVTAEAQRVGAKAGDAAGKTMGQRMSANLGKGLAVGGAALGVGLAIAAKGATELDAATRKFQADTGATAEEAERASHAIAGMYRDNLQGFDAISAALSKVHTDLGLTGDEAERVTGQFLKFGTATGQDASQAVAGLDDILDAWNLSASETPRILDLLVASHQKYGGSIEANEAALGQLAPAMQALGGDVDSTVGLLNLFASTGIDASKATAALNKAVKGLKPGQTLDDLIKQISSIEDPTLRAQEAIKVFGAKGGVALANALRPGITSLKDFVPAAEDVAGATDRASNAIESSFGNQFTLLMKNAGGALAEFGNNFGPLLLVASQFGPKMIGAIGGGLGAIAGKLFPSLVAKVVPGAILAGTTSGAAMGGAAAVAEVATETTGVVAGQAAVGAAAAPAAATAGTAIGTTMGAAAAIALGAALTAAAVIAVGLVYAKIRGDIEAQGRNLADQAGQFTKDATIEQLRQARAGVAEDLAKSRKDVIGDALGLTGSKEIQVILDKLDAEIRARELDGRTLAAGAPENPQLTAVETSVTDTKKQLHSDLQDAIASFHSDSIKMSDAIAQVIAAVKGGSGNAAQTRAIIADLTKRRDMALAAGDKGLAAELTLAIGRLEPFAKGRQWQQEQLARADKVVASNATTAQKVADLKSIEADLLAHQRTMAAQIVQKQIDTITAIHGIRLSAQTGFAVTGPYSQPPKPGKTPPKAPARGRVLLPGDSRSEGHAAGLLGLTRGWTDLGVAGEAGSEAVAILRNPRRLSVPRLGLPSAGVAGSVGPGGAGGNTYQITVPIAGLAPARTPDDIARPLRQLARVGFLDRRPILIPARKTTT